MALTAFVARSFDPADEERIRPIRNFLDTFRKAGFLCEEAEAAEVESVSVKVRKMIDEKDVFVGFFTRRFPIYKFDSRLANAISLVCGRLQPQKWSAPPWVLQESGYAISSRKKLILLRENGVEIPGLQGDLEYVPFDPANPAPILPKLSEMINDLLAKASGREIRTEVAERQEAEAIPLPQAAKEEEKLDSTEEHPSEIVICFLALQDAVAERDLSGIHDAWEAGKKLIAEGQAEKIGSLWWDCLYYSSRYKAGASDGLESLRRIRSEHPKSPEPAIAIAHLLTSAKEYDEAAVLFLEAADLATGNEKAKDLIDAARALNELKRYEKGIEVAEEALSIAAGDTKEDAISVLYQLLKNSEETYFAFAKAEAALHINPQLRIRFDLGLDYRRHSLKELGLYHFKFLHDQTPQEAASLHNLALMYADCHLPITSVKHYKQAFSLGETLSAANLGFTYLDSGMADEATALIRQAMSSEPHDARVEACLAEIPQRTEAEGKKESELLITAAGEREFFVKLGTALQAVLAEVDGAWEFPFGEMALVRKGRTLSGTAEISKKEVGLRGLSPLFGEPAGLSEPRTRTERYTLKGTLKGAVCKFTVTITQQGGLSLGSMGGILGGGDSRSGFIVFADDGKSGTYAQVKDDKLGVRERIVRVKK